MTARKSSMLVAIGTVERAVLTRVQHGNSLPGVIGDARDQVYGVDIRRSDHFAHILKAPCNAETFTDGLQTLLILIANCNRGDVWVVYVDGHEFRAKTKTYDRNI